MSKFREALEQIEIDTSGMLALIGDNEEMFLHFYGLFLSDTNYASLRECIAAKDYEKAFEYAHTLKGASGNLGMTRLFGYAEHMVAVSESSGRETPKN